MGKLPFLSLMCRFWCSRRCERFEMDRRLGYVQAVRRGQSHRAAFVGQETEACNKIKIKQLVSQI